jgi:threonine/homoserine/homoserine lactone efflux protein
MTVGQAIAFVLFAVVAAITPGPGNLLLASTGAAVGILRGLPALLGQVLGMGAMLLLVGVGLGSLILRRPLIVQGLKWCGIGLLAWLAWKLATAGRGELAAQRVHAGFWEVAALQWVNPKAWLVCAGAASAYSQEGAGGLVGRSASLALLFVLTALPCCFVWLAAGASVQRLLRTERASRIFNLAMGAMLAGSALLIAR